MLFFVHVYWRFERFTGHLKRRLHWLERLRFLLRHVLQGLFGRGALIKHCALCQSVLHIIMCLSYQRSTLFGKQDYIQLKVCNEELFCSKRQKCWILWKQCGTGLDIALIINDSALKKTLDMLKARLHSFERLNMLP